MKVYDFMNVLQSKKGQEADTEKTDEPWVGNCCC